MNHHRPLSTLETRLSMTNVCLGEPKASIRTGIAFDLSLMASNAGATVGLALLGKGCRVNLHKVDGQHICIERDD